MAAQNASGRGTLIVVSNRLPVQLKREGAQWTARRSSGGLVSALNGIKDDLAFRWIGWPGISVAPGREAAVREPLQDLGYAPVFLDRRQVTRFYDGFCNSVIWPLFHYLPGRVDFGLPFWSEYQRVNERFADAVLSVAEENAVVWVHDYHLMLLPALLRERKPTLRIGFFLHIPFPTSELFRLLPARRDILRGLLGADVIGFHTHDYARYFANSCLRVLGIQPTPNQVRYEGRRIRYGSYPIGINIAPFQEMLASPAVEPHRQALAEKYKGIHLLLGVDRIDYSKGLPLKFRAFELFLEAHPEWQGNVVLLQVGIPSRMAVGEYRRLKREVDGLVGRINGRFGTAQYSPIQYVAHDVDRAELCALYERADALIVNSIRDGMNLVALEYVACQKGRRGVLVLSEFAGASSSMGGAVFINPWDTRGTAEAIFRSLTMEDGDRTTRSLQNYTYVRTFHSLGWARRFLRDLAAQPGDQGTGPTDLVAEFFRLRREYQQASRRVLFLDYDGTLVPFVGQPSEARPSDALLRVLRGLCKDRANDVYLVSGRTTEELERWFGDMPANLAAEHGLFLRPRGAGTWEQRQEIQTDWMPPVEKVLDDYTRRVPGSFVERKRGGLSWNYRSADEKFGEWQALELALHLDGVLSNLPARVLQGSKIIEVRAVGADKGSLVRSILETTRPAPDFILCVGDDLTDEDMFAALPPRAWTCHVGPAPDTQARHFLENPGEVLELLSELPATPQPIV
jgi:trehalose 6-phosphate synthase/phosphatase